MVKRLPDTLPAVLLLLLLLGVLALLAGALLLRRQRAAAAPGSRPGPGSAGGGGGQQHGAGVAVLLLGGLSLLLLAQSVFAAGVPGSRLPLVGLSLLGLLCFASAGRISVTGRSSWLDSRPLRALAAYLGIRPAQVLLLALAPCFAYLTRLAAGDGLQAAQAPAALVAWLVALAAVLAGAYRREPAAVTAGRQEWLLVAGLFLLAFLLRAYRLDTLPPTLTGDEASAGLVAVQFRQGQATNLWGLGWFSFPAFYFAVQSSGLWLLGQSAAALRLTSALAGALTVVAVYWLARSLFDRLTAVLAAGYLLASHYHIHFSRIGLQNIWDGLFIALALWGIWTGWRRGRRTPFLIGGLALGLGQYFYVSVRILPVLLLLWALFAWWRARERLRRRLPDLLLAAWVALVVVLPLALLFATHPDEFQAPLRRVSVFNDGWLQGEMAHSGDGEGLIILKQVRDTALGFTHLPLRHWYNPGSPLLLALPAALFLAGLLWLLAAPGLGPLLLLLPLLALVLMGGFSQDAPASQRYVLALPSVAVLVTLPLAQGVSWLSTYWQERRRLLALLAVLGLSLVAANDLRYYFFEVYDSYILGGYNTETATAVAHYLRAHSPPDQQVYFFGPPRMGYASHSTIPYLAPAMRGQDVPASPQAPESWRLDGPTLFIFLPERVDERSAVEAAFPGGRAVTGPASAVDGAPLFFAYEVTP